MAMMSIGDRFSVPELLSRMLYLIGLEYQNSFTGQEWQRVLTVFAQHSIP